MALRSTNPGQRSHWAWGCSLLGSLQRTSAEATAPWRSTWPLHCPLLHASHGPGDSLRAAISTLETACMLAEEAEQREPVGNGEERVYRGGLSRDHCFPRNVDLDTLILHATHLVTPLPSPLPHLLAHPLQPWTSCHSLNRQECSLPQGLCTGCSSGHHALPQPPMPSEESLELSGERGQNGVPGVSPRSSAPVPC